MHRLLPRLLAALAASSSVAACGSATITERDACYVPGQPIGDVQTVTPALPCLAKTDPKLSFLDPGCTRSFAVLSGPTSSTTAQGAAQCCYRVEYERIEGCQVGRPLATAEGLRVARAVNDEGWS